MKNYSVSCRSCRTTPAHLVDYKTLKGNIIRVCQLCRQELIEIAASLQRQQLTPAESLIADPRFKHVRLVRTSLPNIPKLTRLLLPDHVREKMPAAVFNESGIIMLHGGWIATALRFDGIETQQIWDQTQIYTEDLNRYLRGIYDQSAGGCFKDYIDWLVKYRYTVNHLMLRDDWQAIIQNDATLRTSIAVIDDFTKTEIVNSLNALKTEHLCSNRHLAKVLMVGKDVINRILIQNKNVSDAQYANIKIRMSALISTK